MEVHLSYASQTNITQGLTVPADYEHLIEVFGNIVSEDGILLVSWVDFGRAINVTKGWVADLDHWGGMAGLNNVWNVVVCMGSLICKGSLRLNNKWKLRTVSLSFVLTSTSLLLFEGMPQPMVRIGETSAAYHLRSHREYASIEWYCSRMRKQKCLAVYLLFADMKPVACILLQTKWATSQNWNGDTCTTDNR